MVDIYTVGLYTLRHMHGKLVQFVPVQDGPPQDGPVQGGPVQCGPVQCRPVQGESNPSLRFLNNS